jgi:hypothetical protein
MNRTIGAIILGGCMAAFIGWVVVKNANPADPAGGQLQPLPDNLEPDASLSRIEKTFDSRFVGHTRDAIRAKFGTPNLAWDGDYGLPVGGEGTRNHPPEVTTMVYSTRSGTLYLGFRQVAGEWVCSHETWLPEGARF